MAEAERDLIDILKHKTSPTNSRMKAMASLANSRHPKSILAFKEVLQDETEPPDIRSAAALALGKLGGEEVLDILIPMACVPDETVRMYVIEALGVTAHERVIPVLIQALKDTSNHVFASAAEALNRVGPAVVPYLIRLLDEGAYDARCIAAWQLGELRGGEALPKLVEVVNNNENIEVTALSIWALGEIGSQIQYDMKDAMHVLTVARKHQEPEIRLRADSALKKIVRGLN